MSTSAYHVRPIGRRRAWSVDLEGFWGRETLESEADARLLAAQLARANRPSLVIVHGAGDEVRERQGYVALPRSLGESPAPRRA